MLLSMHRLSPESYLHVDGKRRKQKRRQKSRSLQPSHRNLIYFRREGGDYPVNLNLRNYIHCKHSHSKPSISINLTRIAAEDRSISEDESSLKVVKQPEQAYLKWSAAFWSKGDIRLAEAMCIEVDGKKVAPLEIEGPLIALLTTLLHGHHGFFLASQHASSPLALRRLAAKYAMPAHMWRHGIYLFLELLRHGLPHTPLPGTHAHFYLSRLLHHGSALRNCPSFWRHMDWVRELGRYLMDDIKDREVWTNVARSRYSKADDKRPTVGRLYHHSAVLVRPNVPQQLSFYCKSLAVGQPFASAWESTLPFDAITSYA